MMCWIYLCAHMAHCLFSVKHIPQQFTPSGTLCIQLGFIMLITALFNHFIWTIFMPKMITSTWVFSASGP